MTAQSLFKIDLELFNLVACCERAFSIEEKDAAQLALVEYVSGLTLENPDAIAAWIAEYDGRAEVAKAEAEIAKKEMERLTAHGMQQFIRADMVRQIAIAALRDAHKDSIEGDTCTLKRVKSGGKQALTVHSPGLVPDRYKVWKLELPWGLFKELSETVKEHRKDLLPLVITAKSEVQNDLVRMALDRDAKIPGANLEPRKERLEIR